MPIVTTKTMLLEALASNDRLAEEQIADKATLVAARPDIHKFATAMRDTLAACANSVNAWEVNMLEMLDTLEKRMDDRIAMTRDAGAVAQEGESTP